MMTEFPGLYRRKQEWPPVNPTTQELRQATFIPNGSVTDAQVRDVSARKFKLFGAKVFDSSTTEVGAGATTTMTWDTESFDVGNLWVSGSATRLTLPFAGLWAVQCFGIQSAGSGALNMILKANGTEIGRAVNIGVSADVVRFYLAGVDDYLEVDMTESTSANTATVGAGVTNNFLLAAYMGGL